MKKQILKLTFLSLTINLIFLSNLSFSQNGWVQQSSGTSSNLYSVTFIDINTGTAVGAYGIIRRTTNGGVNWFSQTSGTSNTLYSVYFVNANTGTIIGSGGIIRRTTNGGINWFPQDGGTSQTLRSVYFINANTGVIVGNIGTIRRTTNGGINWFSQSSGTTQNLNSVYLINANIGTTVGDNGIVRKTTNSGLNWFSQTVFSSYTLTSVYFIDTNIGIITKSNYNYTRSIYRTTNGGIVWNEIYTGSVHTLRAVDFPNSNSGYLIGDEGDIFKSSNSGANWTFHPAGVMNWFYDGSFANVNTGWVVGTSGIILHTKSGGSPVPLAPTLVSPPNNSVNISTTPTLTWNTSQGATSYSVQISSIANFQVITDSATVTTTQYQVPAGKLQSGNTYFWRVNASNSAGSSAWSSIWNFTTSLSPPITPVLISPPNGSQVTATPLLDWNDVGSATSYRLQVSEAANFITTVIDQVSLTQSNYQVPNGILSSNVKYYWRARARNAGGWSPWASAWNFTTSLIGINTIVGEIPTEYYLYTNYPNPFNPSTTIRFDIPKSSQIKIIVYNSLGKKISELVNDKLNAGSYEVEWNALDHPSGMYFYKFETNEFMDVRKMILLK